MKKRLFSGLQPSGEIHLGNYLGAIQNWVSLMDTYECIYCIVDYHAITATYDVAMMRENIEDALLVYIACGIDPEAATIFLQSDVPEHTELAWIFNTVTPMGLLERMTQYKDKAKQNKENVNVGLFDYPVLQAADILLYKAEMVPVGQDQVQHVEFTRDVARKFNNLYGDAFPEPKALLSHTPKVLGLDGKSKMSKSMKNYVSVLAEPEVVHKSLATAVTDVNRKRRSDPGNPEVCNIFTLHRSFSSEQEIVHVDTECRTAGIGCIDCKKILANNINTHMEPIRDKFCSMKDDHNYIGDVLAAGAEKIRPIARDTMAEVRDKLGITRKNGG